MLRRLILPATLLALAGCSTPEAMTRTGLVNAGIPRATRRLHGGSHGRPAFAPPTAPTVGAGQGARFEGPQPVLISRAVAQGPGNPRRRQLVGRTLRDGSRGVDSCGALCFRPEHSRSSKGRARPNEHSRISGQGIARQIRRPRPRRLCRAIGRGSGRGREEAARAALCREGADPCRRARQGQVQGTRPRRQGRRPAGQDARRGPRGGDRHARQHAGDDPDRRARQAGQPPLRHRRRRHRQGILPRAARQPRDRPHLDGRLDRGRDGYRDRRARHAREDPLRSTSTRRPASCRITAARSPPRWA